MIKNKRLIISLVPFIFALMACAAALTFGSTGQGAAGKPGSAGIVVVTSIAVPEHSESMLASSFTDCAAVYDAGLIELPSEHPFFNADLDFDHDGIACEVEIQGLEPPAAHVTVTPVLGLEAPPSSVQN